MKYGYIMILTDDDDNDVSVEGGEIDANDPREAAKQALCIETDWLDNQFAGLEPIIEITRNTQFGVFEAHVESHGLGNAAMILEVVEA